MKFYRYIVCAFLFIGAAIAETININWINGDETYAQTTCEIGGDVILPEPPTKRGYTFKGWAQYTRLEYIESTGTQYIVGNINNLTDNDNIDIRVYSYDYTEDGGIFTLFQNNKRYYFTGYGFKEFGGCIYISLDGNTDYRIVEASAKKGYHTITKHNIDGIAPINATTAQTSNMIPANQVTDFMIGRHLTSGTCLAARFIRIKISDKLHLIPARRNFDSAIGMYDTVSGQFFTNAGTGEFIAGPVAENQNFYE